MEYRIIRWNEPLIGRGGEILGNTVVSATAKDLIALKRHNNPIATLGIPDEELLHEFMMVNLAWEAIQ